MADYANLRLESEKISQTSKLNLENLIKLSHHIKSFQEQGVAFVEKTSKDIQPYVQSNKDEKQSSAALMCLQGIYASYQALSFKAKEFLEIMKDTIINPIDIFYKNQSNFYTDILDEMHSMAMEIANVKAKVEDVKQQYVASSIAACEHEKNIELTFTGKQANTIDELNTCNDKFLQAKAKTYALESQYKNEIQKFNIELTLYNKKYMYLMGKSEKNEESRIVFLKDIMSKYAKFTQELSSIQKEMSETLKKLSDSISIEEEMKSFKKEFNFSVYGERFMAEEFVPYRSTELNELPLAEDSLSSPKSTSFSDDRPAENTEIAFDANNYSNHPMDTFIMSIFGQKEIEIQSISLMIEALYNNQQSSKLFIDSILSKKTKNFWFVENLINLQHFANILNAISLNFENSSDNLYDITFAIIFISERTYYHSKKETVYLCSLLSQNKFYTNKAHWIEMIEFKLTRKLEEHVNHLLVIDIVPPKEEKKDILQYFGSGIKGIKSVFGKDSVTGGNSLLENLKISKHIHNYKKLPEYKKPYLDSFATKEIHLIIKEFIPHLCNFNFGVTEVIDTVVELSTKYRVPMERMNYYVSNIGAWTYTIKKRLPGMFKVEVIVDKIKMIKEKRMNLIQAKYPIAKTINEATLENKMKIIVEVAKYFKMNELGFLFVLCKSIKGKCRVKIFKEMLGRENLSLKERMKIWYCLLNITDIKRRYSYAAICKEIEDKREEVAIPLNILGVIKLDVLRTAFASNVEESKKALASILKGVAYIKPKLNYCQGMNYIASFLYQLLGNEEETFYVMMGLVDHTDFAMIFMEDLQKLKIFFYIFERLLNIFLPDVSYTFKLSSVNVNYFCPPWFLTLFTNTATIVDVSSPPKVVLKIWDEFFLKGWKALMTAGLSIISHNQRKLLSLKYDEVLHFLLNDVIKSNFFKNKFFENFLLLLSQLKLNKKLITNLETEYQYELKDKTKKH